MTPFRTNEWVTVLHIKCACLLCRLQHNLCHKSVVYVLNLSLGFEIGAARESGSLTLITFPRRQL